MNNIIASTIALLIAISATDMFAQDSPEPESQTQSRLDVKSEGKEAGSKVELDGLVKARNKYSIVVASGDRDMTVTFEKDTSFVLKLSGPRIDFEKKQLIVDIEGAEKRYRGYTFTTPLYVRIDFAHQNQLKRIRDQKIKRLSSYRLSSVKPSPPARKDSIYWIGELSAGESNRQLKLQIGDEVFDILLAKNGKLDGFSIANLLSNRTKVRVTGKLKDDHVVAREVVFWPVSPVSSDSSDIK